MNLESLPLGGLHLIYMSLLLRKPALGENVMWTMLDNLDLSEILSQSKQGTRCEFKQLNTYTNYSNQANCLWTRADRLTYGLPLI